MSGEPKDESKSPNPSEHFQEIIGSAREGIIILDTELRYVLWNSFMQELSGVPESAVLGKHPWDVFPFLRHAGGSDQLRDALAGHTVTAPDLLATDPTTGITSWTSGRVSPLRHKNGDIMGVLVLIRDITDRKLAEENLRAAKSRFRTLIDHSHEAILLISADGKLVYANPAITRITGYSVDEFLAQSLFFTTYVDDKERVAKLFAEVVLDPARVVSTEVRISHKDGSVRWVEAVGKNLLGVEGITPSPRTCGTSPSARRAKKIARNSNRRSSTRNAWKAWASWLAASPTISTISSSAFWAMPIWRCSTCHLTRRREAKSRTFAPPPFAPRN